MRSVTISARTGCSDVTVLLPLSKSLSARAIIISMLTDGGVLPLMLSRCDDTLTLLHGVDVKSGEIDVGAAGTAMRFLTAFHAVSPGHDVLIDGSARMRERPIGVLVDALRSAGVEIEYLGKEGFPPLHVVGTRVKQVNVTLRGDVSSQYVSALMMVMPCCGGGVLHLSSPLTSLPYVEMTAALMRHYGASVNVSADAISVADVPYVPRDYRVETDWSAASYWYGVAALLPGLRVHLPDLSLNDVQGDSDIRRVMSLLGVTTQELNDEILLEGGKDLECSTCPIMCDMAAMPDVAQTVIVTACLLGRRFAVSGLSTLRIKETDRVEALRVELGKLGYLLHCSYDTITWDGARCPRVSSPVIETYKDHRMAMSMALAGLVSQGGIEIVDADVVSKSYPDFWNDLAKVALIGEVSGSE